MAGAVRGRRLDWLAYWYRHPVDSPAVVALRCSAAKRSAVPMTIENQIIIFYFVFMVLDWCCARTGLAGVGLVRDRGQRRHRDGDIIGPRRFAV